MVKQTQKIKHGAPPRLIVFLWGIGCSFLAGCGSSFQGGTPVVQKHATRGYNKPYQIKGTWYHPQPHYEYCETGHASYYGGKDGCHGLKTSTGDTFDKHALTAAHKELPLPCVVEVKNLENGRRLKLKVIDHGPFIDGRIIDVSEKAAKMLGFHHKGTAPVQVTCLVPESIRLAHAYKPKSSGLRHRQKKPHRLQDDGDIRVAQKQHQSRSQTAHQVVASSQESKINGSFVQIGVFSNPEHAQQLVRTATQKFCVPVRAYRYNRKQQPVYRVLMGPFRSAENAHDMLHQVKTHGHERAVVVHHRPRMKK